MSLSYSDSVQQVAIFSDQSKWGTDSYYYWPKSPDGILIQIEYFEKKAVNVALLNLETGATQGLTEGVDYDLTDPSASGDKYLYPLVSLTEKYGSYQSYDYMVIWRASDFLQQEDFAEGTRINPLAIKNEFSRLYSELQEIRDSVNRAVHVSKTDPSLPNSTVEDETSVWAIPEKSKRADKTIGFDSNGSLKVVDLDAYIDKMDEISTTTQGYSEKAEKQVQLAKIEVSNAQTEVSNAKAEVEKAKEQVALATAQADLAEVSADNAKVYEENTRASFENFKKAIPQFVYNSASDELTIFVQELTPETESHIISIPTAEDMENADTEHIEKLMALHDEMTAKYVIPITMASTVTVEGMGGEASFSALLATVTKTEIQDGLEAYHFEIPLRNDTGDGASYLLFYVGVRMAEVGGQIMYVASGGSILMLPFFSDSYWAEIDGKGYSVTVTVSNPA